MAKQSSAREARQTKSAASAAGSAHFLSAPTGAQLDCFASLAMTVVGALASPAISA
jgi:hypothetical protein